MEPRRSRGCRPSATTKHWPAMTAFALPSFYDGRIHINLPRAAERRGEACCQGITQLILW